MSISLMVPRLTSQMRYRRCETMGVRARQSASGLLGIIGFKSGLPRVMHHHLASDNARAKAHINLGWSLSDANRLRASSFSALAVNISARGFCMFPLCPQGSTNAPAQPPRATDIWHAAETLSLQPVRPAHVPPVSKQHSQYLY